MKLLFGELFKELFPAGPDFVVVHAGRIVAPVYGFYVGTLKKALLYELVQIYEQRIAFECVQAVIRRVAVACGLYRQHLPPLLTGFGKKIDEIVSGLPQAPDPVL